MCLQNGAIFRLWHQKWCRFREWNFYRGIKIDAILITSSLIPSRLSHLARVIFKKIYFLYLFPVGEVIYQGVFQNFSNPLPQLSDPKNEALSESFSKKCSHPSTARFGSENGHTFQKSFPKSVPQVFLSESQRWSKKLSTTVTGTFKVQNCTPISKKA